MQTIRPQFQAGSHSKLSRSRAFTLIELLIVLSMLAILSAIAIASYREYVLRSGRTEAMTALKELSNLEEKYYANQLTYTGTMSTLSYATTTPNDLYQLSIATNPTVRYTLQATAIDAQLEDRTCRTFTLNGMDEHGAVDSDGHDTTQECWNR